jgi:hypothetical protein
MKSSEMNTKQEQGNVTTDLSMSLDGFIAGPNTDPQNTLGDEGHRIIDLHHQEIP